MVVDDMLCCTTDEIIQYKQSQRHSSSPVRGMAAVCTSGCREVRHDAHGWRWLPRLHTGLLTILYCVWYGPGNISSIIIHRLRGAGDTAVVSPWCIYRALGWFVSAARLTRVLRLCGPSTQVLRISSRSPTLVRYSCIDVSDRLVTGFHCFAVINTQCYAPLLDPLKS